MELKPHEIENLGNICFFCASKCNYKEHYRCPRCKGRCEDPKRTTLFLEFEDLPACWKEHILRELNSRPIDEREIVNKLSEFLLNCSPKELKDLFVSTFNCVDAVEGDNEEGMVVYINRDVGEKWS